MGRAPEGTDIRLYDVNEDGIVDAADIVCIINAMP
jgi:coenzyme F420-reducing hydrogenase alpha subunit